MFAAFPAWYATLFSGLYLALLLVLVALIARGVAFEFRDKVGRAALAADLDLGDDARQRRDPAAARDRARRHGRRAADRRRRRVRRRRRATSSRAYGVWTGLTLLSLSVLHGATFLALKTDGAVRERSRARRRAARDRGRRRRARLRRLVAVRAERARGRRRDRRGRAAARRAARAGPSPPPRPRWPPRSARCSSTSSRTSWSRAPTPRTTSPSSGAASGSYALKVMTVAAAVFVPLVLLYQGWTYRVFRARVGASRSQDSA